MLDCPCGNITNFKDMVQCKICSSLQHKTCVLENLSMMGYECPSCQLKYMDPYIRFRQNILTPTLIAASRTNTTKQLSFALPDLVARTRTSNSKFIILRCLRIDGKGFEHHWPMNCSIKINESFIKAYSAKRDVTRSAERKDYPIVFYFDESQLEDNYHKFNTSHLYCSKDYLFSGRTNSIKFKNEVSKNLKDTYAYVISIDLFEIVRRVDELIETIEICRDKELLAKRQTAMSNPKCDLAVAKENVSLLDNYTNNNKRIDLPVRSINCKHLQVFDLRSYLVLRRNKIYNCPVCKTKAVRLYVDGVIKDILDSPQYKDFNYVVVGLDYNIQPWRRNQPMVHLYDVDLTGSNNKLPEETYKIKTEELVTQHSTRPSEIQFVMLSDDSESENDHLDIDYGSTREFFFNTNRNECLQSHEGRQVSGDLAETSNSVFHSEKNLLSDKTLRSNSLKTEGLYFFSYLLEGTRKKFMYAEKLEMLRNKIERDNNDKDKKF